MTTEFSEVPTVQNSTSDYTIGSSIPVIRMLDEQKTKSFYIDWLGFKIEWEHRFRDSPDSPLYAQIRLGDALLHLNGHVEDDSPVTEVRIPVDGIEAYRDLLQARNGDATEPCIVDPRYTGEEQDMNIYDPSGNLLVFWRREK